MCPAVAPRRRTVLLALLAAVGLAAAFLLHRVLATVFFAVTVATVLVPLYQWLRRRGLPRWWASAVSTVVAYVGGLSLLLPVGAVLYLRRTQFSNFLASLPDRVEISVAEFTYAVDTSDTTEWLADYLTDLAIGLVRAAPELVAHATVVGFVVFGLLLGRTRARRALLLPVPDGYHDVLQALHVRARDTLFALYVIQAATSLATFVVALIVFWSLGYPYPVTLAVAAGLLQFLPVVGPSLLVVGLAAYEASAGAYVPALLVLALGLTFIAFLPDAVLRPRLARETAGLPASLYFVGFTGGILSVGPVGIIAGPLVVALLVETLSILAREDGAGGYPADTPGHPDTPDPPDSLVPPDSLEPQDSWDPPGSADPDATTE